MYIRNEKFKSLLSKLTRKDTYNFFRRNRVTAVCWRQHNTICNQSEMKKKKFGAKIIHDEHYLLGKPAIFPILQPGFNAGLQINKSQGKLDRFYRPGLRTRTK